MASAVVAVVGWLGQQLPGTRVLTRTTASLEADLPQIRIVGVGGTQVQTLGQERIAVQTFAADEPTAIEIAQIVHDMLLLQLRGRVGDAVISKITAISLPAFHGYDNPNVAVQTATYAVAIRTAY